jgi:hypothetical protein
LSLLTTLGNKFVGEGPTLSCGDGGRKPVKGLSVSPPDSGVLQPCWPVRISSYTESRKIKLYTALKVATFYDTVRFQVLTAASMKLRFVFWDVLPCKIIVDRRFRGTCCLHHQGDECLQSEKLNSYGGPNKGLFLTKVL